MLIVIGLVAPVGNWLVSRRRAWPSIWINRNPSAGHSHCTPLYLPLRLYRGVDNLREIGEKLGIILDLSHHDLAPLQSQSFHRAISFAAHGRLRLQSRHLHYDGTVMHSMRCIKSRVTPDSMPGGENESLGQMMVWSGLPPMHGLGWVHSLSHHTSL